MLKGASLSPILSPFTLAYFEIPSGWKRHAQGLANCLGDRCDIRDHHRCDRRDLGGVVRDVNKVKRLA
jgi:hypothetical protein